VQGDHADDEDDEDDAMEAAAAASPATALAERTLARAKRQLASAKAIALPGVKLSPLRDAEARKAIASAQRAGTALTGFEPFGRDATRTACVVTARGGFELCASWESQACFGSSFLEILTGPRDEAERAATISSVHALCDRLTTDGIVSTFCLSAADDADLAMVYLSTGFRRSGVLAQHLQVGDARKDAIVWSRKLGANAES
jgi:hypothetical protein